MNFTIENPLTAGHVVRSKKSAHCLAVVRQRMDRIQQLRQLDMSWNDIASHLGISRSSLRAAVKQLTPVDPAGETDMPKALRPKSTVYFASEADKQLFLAWMEDIKNGDGAYDG